MTTTVAPAEQELRRIAGDVWSTVLGLDLRPRPTAAASPGERVFTGCVQITGDWDGAVTLHLPHHLARRAAAVMFATDPSDLVDDDLRDVVGELTNMTGGNVKALVGGTCQLSLPAVTEGPDHLVSLPGSVVLTRLAFDADGDPLLLTLFARAPTR